MSSFFFVFSLFKFVLSLSFMSSVYGLILEIIMVDISSWSFVMTTFWLDISDVYQVCNVYFFYSNFYSFEYMEGDLNMNRFILLAVMFVASMLLLIFSPNLISILLGWEGLGLVSYCLVIYYQNLKVMSDEKINC